MCQKHMVGDRSGTEAPFVGMYYRYVSSMQISTLSQWAAMAVVQSK